MYINKVIKILPSDDKEGVIPRDRPTVPNADIELS